MKQHILGIVFVLSTWPLASSADALLERGAYLVNGIVACGNCHTPQTPTGPDMQRRMAGQLVMDAPPFTAWAPNITPDTKTGIGGWSEDDLVRAIRDGLRPDGTLIGPPMPIGLYRGMADDDARAIARYIRSLPAVDNAVSKSTYRIPLPPSYGPPVGKVTAPDRADPVAYGGYLAGPLGHCIECHTPPVDGRPDFANQLGAGGFVFPGPWGTSVSANITPHRRDGIHRYSDAEVEKMIRRGVQPDGERMKPPMGYGYYANISDRDMKALLAYLRSLKPVASPRREK